MARFNGGDNAGHTVTVGPQTFKLHLVPSGIIHPHTVGAIGNGVVIYPATLLSEMAMLRAAGVVIHPRRLLLAYTAHLITPAHRALDLAQERARGSGQIGTTGRGIGPAYTDKASRRGLRLEDMLDPATFREKVIAPHRRRSTTILHALYFADPLDRGALADEYEAYARTMAPYICDVGAVLDSALRAGKRVLAEGAQGTLLDLDQRHVSVCDQFHPHRAGALVGLGLGIQPVGRVVGVTKAFQTRVGSGLSPPRCRGMPPSACAARAPTRGTSSAPPPAARAGWAGWTACCCAIRCASTG